MTVKMIAKERVDVAIARVTKIVTHVGFHWDEAVALFLLKTFPSNNLPGATMAPIEFSADIPTTVDPDELRKEGVILLGVGGGEFDEHPNNGAKRKKDECCATLVAQALGLNNHPEFRQLLDYTKRIDLKGGSTVMELSSLMKFYHAQNPGNDAVLWKKIVLPLLTAHWWGQKDFLDCEKIWETWASQKEVTLRNGNKLLLAAVETDNPQMGKFARSRHDCSVLIQQNSKGQVQIMSNKKHKVNLCQVVAKIREAEQRARGASILPLSEMEGEGRVAGAECWWYHEEAQSLFNGSPLTNPNVEATKLDIGTIKEIVLDYVMC